MSTVAQNPPQFVPTESQLHMAYSVCRGITRERAYPGGEAGQVAGRDEVLGEGQSVAPYQGKLGIVAICVGIWFVIANFIRF